MFYTIKLHNIYKRIGGRKKSTMFQNVCIFSTSEKKPFRNHLSAGHFRKIQNVRSSYVRCTERWQPGEPGSFPSVRNRKSTLRFPAQVPGHEARYRKARRDEVRYGYDSEYRRRRHGTYGATSSTILVPSVLTPYDLVE